MAEIFLSDPALLKPAALSRANYTGLTVTEERAKQFLKLFDNSLSEISSLM
jgi:hypothetical protein